LRNSHGFQEETMVLFGIFVVWLPQLIAYASTLFTLVLMVKAWRVTGNKGFLWLAIVTVIGQFYFLALKMGGWERLAATFMSRVIVGYWYNALLGIAGTAAWWLLYKHLAIKETSGDNN